MNAAAASVPFIRLDHVQKSYGLPGRALLAISDISFEVEAGEFVSLVGPSGCGKSTLLKMLTGLIRQDGGEIRIGSAGRAFDPARDIGMVFQQPLLLKWRTILDNVLLPAEILGLPLHEARAHALYLLALVGLAGFEHSRPYELSGGMQHDPKLVLMDEPFGALDALTRERMNVELHRIWKKSEKTILFVTHSISEAVFLGTQVIVLSARPARMAARIAIKLPEPRTLESKTHENFGAYARRIYDLLGMG